MYEQLQEDVNILEIDRLASIFLMIFANKAESSVAK